MKSLRIGLCVAGAWGFWAQCQSGPVPPPDGKTALGPKVECATLRSLTGYEFTVELAALIPASQDAPEYCHVRGQVLPEVQFEVNLPTSWDQRFTMFGNGGWAGNDLDAPNSAGAHHRALRAGFVTAATNTGHDAALEPGASFAQDRQKLLDYAFRSLHVTAETAKRIAAVYYGARPARSYFQGCSTGGRQALILAQRFPEDFDGIIAGAPVLDFTGTMVSFACNALAVASGPLPYAKLSLLADRIYDECDAKDGLKDGLIDDPRRCDFQPSRDLPKCAAGADNADCFTAAQIGALEKIYGDITSRGRRIFPGWPVSGEVAGPNGHSGWSAWIVQEHGGQTIEGGFAEEFFRYMASPRPNPKFDLASFDVNNDPEKLTWIHKILDATDTDLSGFQKHGGKLLMFHGWADQALNARMSVEYYERVTQRMGASTKDFFRLFMVPGMFHCGGGIGTGTFDMLAPLMTWVEQGTAPDRIAAARVVNGKTVRTRPLCPYPQIAKYKGSGSIDEAENFACTAP